MLGYSVHALEPAEDLNRIAQHRCEALKSHYQRRSLPEVHFHQSTLEEIEFAENQLDAILFFDVLHHVVDENLAFAKTYRFLKPGRRIGVIDPSWHPDFKDLEDQMVGEMQKFGTLENPFSTQYLDHLLTKTGFIEFVRVVSVNGMFSKDQLDQPIRNFAHCPIEGSNNITAFKPSLDEQRYPSCCVAELRTDAQLTIVSGGIDANSRSANLVVDLKNTGETRFDSRATRIGHVRFAMRKNQPGSTEFVECSERPFLSEMLLPGQSIRMLVSFALPADCDINGWELDLVADDAYWFSTKNIAACNVTVQGTTGAEQ
jgi:SAM-dependent methyltransferase